MRKSRFTESQIVDILKQGEVGVPIAESRHREVLVSISGLNIRNDCEKGFAGPGEVSNICSRL